MKTVKVREKTKLRAISTGEKRAEISCWKVYSMRINIIINAREHIWDWGRKREARWSFLCLDISRIIKNWLRRMNNVMNKSGESLWAKETNDSAIENISERTPYNNRLNPYDIVAENIIYNDGVFSIIKIQIK